jgi:hypothetical protein
MALSAEVLAEEPEESIHRLQRQRTTRIIMTVVALVAVFAVTGLSVTLTYQKGPEAAASPVNQ